MIVAPDGDDGLLDAARRRQAYIAAETLATAVSYESLDGAAPVEIDGRSLQIGVALA